MGMLLLTCVNKRRLERKHQPNMSFFYYCFMEVSRVLGTPGLYRRRYIHGNKRGTIVI